MTTINDTGTTAGSATAGSTPGPHPGQALSRTALPQAGSRSGAAPLRNNNYQLLQVVLFWAGAILLPTGLVVILLGYYGAANTPYQYDQLSYLVSGGLFGLGLTFVGGFLYFGAWLARIADDGRQSSKRLADTLLLLADVTSRAAATSDNGVDLGATRVIAGGGATVHRRDCALVQHREDLRPAGHAVDLTECRVCRP